MTKHKLTLEHLSGEVRSMRKWLITIAFLGVSLLVGTAGIWPAPF